MILVLAFLLVKLSIIRQQKSRQKTPVKTLFANHCSPCHPQGGNLQNPNKTLMWQSLEAGGLTTIGAITQYILDPPPKMPRLFHENATPSKEDARRLAVFILKTFAPNQYPLIQARSDKLEGAALFSKYCANCHPGGGNSIHPQKDLGKAGLAARGFSTEASIVEYIKAPGAGMPNLLHRQSKLSEEDARKIAQFILETF